MQPSLIDPSPAYALGQLSDLLKERREVASVLAHDGDDPAPLRRLIAERAQLRELAQATKQAASASARTLAENNQAQAEMMPRLNKLLARAESLRLAQMAQSDAESARALRRSRAQMAVQIEDLQREVDAAQAAAQVAREQLASQQRAALDTKERQTASQQQLSALQRQRVGAVTRCRAIALDVMVAHATWRVDAPKTGAEAFAAWAQAMRHAAQAYCVLHARMAEGHFAQDEVDALLGGRAPLTGEVLWGLLALGDKQAARSAFVQLCEGHDFLHQIFHVYRAYCAGLWLLPDHPALAEALRLHRLSQGLRGALSDCLWALMHRDSAGFARVLPQVVQLDAATWQRSDTPALGLVSLLGCGLVRLGRAAGLRVPTDLGPTVPEGPWSVAGGQQVG